MFKLFNFSNSAYKGFTTKKFNIDNIRKAKTPYLTVTKSMKNDIKFDKTIFKCAVGSYL